jgi:serine/threonine protein kinase
VSNRGNVYDWYTFGDVIGKGNFGVVRTASHKQSDAEFAVKIIPKMNGGRPGANSSDFSSALHAAVQLDDRPEGLTSAMLQLEREIEVLSFLQHPNIVKLIDSFEDVSNVFMVMELCSGGQLLEFILRRNYLSEGQVAFVMRQVFRALEYMHGVGVGVVHRDLKPDNCALRTAAPLAQNIVQLIDFGFCVRAETGQVMRSQHGTPLYMAPQVFKGLAYDSSCDMWSCGVILYTLCCGYPPFNGALAADVEAKVKRGNYTINQEHWGGVSEDAKDLVRGLLKMKPHERLTAAQSTGHRWILAMADRAAEEQSLAFPPAVLESLRAYVIEHCQKPRTGVAIENVITFTHDHAAPSGDAGWTFENILDGSWLNTTWLEGSWLDLKNSFFHGCCSDDGARANCVASLQKQRNDNEWPMASYRKDCAEEVVPQGVAISSVYASQRQLPPTLLSTTHISH